MSIVDNKDGTLTLKREPFVYESERHDVAELVDILKKYRGLNLLVGTTIKSELTGYGMLMEPSELNKEADVILAKHREK